MKTALVLWGATDFGAPHFSSDILWKTGFRAPDPFFLVETAGKVYVLVSALEIGRAHKEARGARAVLADAHGLVGFLKTRGIKKVMIPHGFPHGIARELGRTFRTDVHEGVVFAARIRKSKTEIVEITRVQRAAEAALAEAMKFLSNATIRSGRIYPVRNPDDKTKTIASLYASKKEVSNGVYFKKRVVASEDVRRIMEDVLWQEGCMASGTIVACGMQASDPHCIGRGMLEAHKPIVIDVFPVSRDSHYYADMSRTIFKGEPAFGYAHMYEAVRSAQEAAIGMVRAGADGAAIHAAAAEHLESLGYQTYMRHARPEGFIHGLGHGVGIDIHEAPRLSARGDILEEGNVVTIEPGLYYTRARKGIPAGGIRIEDMAVVRKNGCEMITRFPKDLKSMIL